MKRRVFLRREPSTRPPLENGEAKVTHFPVQFGSCRAGRHGSGFERRDECTTRRWQQIRDRLAELFPLRAFMDGVLRGPEVGFRTNVLARNACYRKSAYELCTRRRALNINNDELR